MRLLPLILPAIFIFNLSLAQNNIGIGTISPNPNALLDLDNTGSPLGLLLPRQDISTFTLGPLDAGMMVFNPVDNKVYTWDGSVWVSGSSEWGVNGSDIFNLNSGNVGIGLSSPVNTMDVEGNMAIGTTYSGTNAAPANGLLVEGNVIFGDNTLANGKLAIYGADWSNGRVYLQSNGTVGPAIRFENSQGGSIVYDIIGSTGTGASPGIGHFGIYDNTSGAYRFIIDPSGRVEIPVLSDATGASNTGALQIAGSLRIDGDEIITNTNSTLSIQSDNNGDLAIDGNTFYVDASADRIGIGDNSPLAALEVVGDVIALNGAFAINTIGGDIGASANVDHIWHNDGTNSWHMVSDDTYKATGNTTLTIGRLLVHNDATSNCTTGGSPFFIESCNDISSELEFNFAGNFTGTQTTAMPDLDILAVSDGFGIIGTFSDAGRFDFRQNNSVMVSIANNTIYPGSDNAGSCGSSSLRWNTVYASNGTINTSDQRLKKNIQNLDYGLGKVMQLRPVTFEWKDNSSGKKIGLIAQELQEIIPEVVEIGDDENKTLGVYYSDLIPVLVKAIQDQQSEIESLKEKVNTIETSIRN